MTSFKNPLLKNIDSGELIEIVKSPFTIGRGLGSDYVIKSKVVSRTHCSLEKTENGWVLDDLSTNGTMVNDDLFKATRSSVLKSNDEICLGFHTYTYKFLIDTERVPNLQVEKLKATKICTPSSSPSPGSPSSFDENGISDEVLNNLADDILHTVEETDRNNETNIVCLEQTSSQIIPPSTKEFKDVPDNPNGSETDNCGQTSVLKCPISEKNIQPTYPCDKIIDPVRVMLQESPQDLMQQNESEEHTKSEMDIFKILMEGTNLSGNDKGQTAIRNEPIGQENNNIHIPQTSNLQEEIIHIPQDNLQEETVLIPQTNLQEETIGSLIVNNCSPTSKDILPNENTIAEEIENPNDNVAYSLSNEQSLKLPLVQENNKPSDITTTVPAISAEEITDPVERFKIHFDAILDEVVKGTSTSPTVNNSPPLSDGILGILSAIEENANAKESEKSNNIATHNFSKEHSLELPLQATNKLSNASATTTRPAVSVEKVVDPVEQFKMHFDAVLDEVVKGTSDSLAVNNNPSTSSAALDLPIVEESIYSKKTAVISEHSNITSANSGSILTTSERTLTPLSTYISTIQPTASFVPTNQNIPLASTISVTSGSNSSKKIKVMAATSRNSIYTPMMTTAIPGIKLSNSPNVPRLIIIKPHQIPGVNSLVQNTVGNLGQPFQHIGTAQNLTNTTDILRSARLINVPASLVHGSTTSSGGASTSLVANREISSTVTIDTHEPNKTEVETTTKCKDSQEPSTSTAVEKLPSKKEQNQGFDQNQFEEMENELMCAICANLFIKAVTLSCSHSFCFYCIEQWKKKKSDCPICRNEITSSTRTLVLDNIIEKMLENSSLEDRTQRNEAVEERNKIEEAENASKKQNNDKRNRNTARRGRVASGRAPPAPPHPPTPSPPMINLVDSPSTTDTENSDYDDDEFDDYDDYYADEWYNGRPGAYFGGYGRCYRCGDRGHWANGCPNR